jgi:hypothetical protein
MIDFRALCARMADKLDHYHQLLMDDRRATHALATEARAALAQPEPARQPTFAELLMPPPSAALAQPAPVAPTDEEIYKLALDGDFLVDVGDGVSCMVQDEVDFARAVLARWGTPTAQPVPVSERLPGPENCDAEGRCWWWHEETGDVLPHWVFAPAEVVENQYLAWLPHWTLPVPGVEGEP